MKWGNVNVKGESLSSLHFLLSFLVPSIVLFPHFSSIPSSLRTITQSCIQELTDRFCNFMHLCHPTPSLVKSLQASQRLSKRNAAAEAAKEGAGKGGDLGWTPGGAKGGAAASWQPRNGGGGGGGGDAWEPRRR
jgi:hypothetical protein